MTNIIQLTGEDVRLAQQLLKLLMRSISDETDQTFSQISSLRTRARRGCRLYRLSTDVWRWPLADGFKVDDPAYGVSVADLSWKKAHLPSAPTARPRLRFAIWCEPGPWS